jgi:phosphopantothenoylcysteine decarboxylase/phosphopantothenate--cysteine ligase
VLEPGSGHLAGGDDGPGRLRPAEDIVAECERILAAGGDLAGRRVLVTSGGTREPIDPVRFIGNRSSGKQGHAVAAEAVRRGAAVVMVTTVDRPVAAGVEVVRVDNAAEMLAAVTEVAPTADVVVMAAAVADWRPKAVAPSKMKKDDGIPDLVLETTVDILTELGRDKRDGQVLVGFAAETDDVRANAAAKLARKRIDLIVANDVAAAGAGFEHDTNQVVLLGADGSARDVPLASKEEVARAVVDAVVARLGAVGQAGRP